MDYRIDSVLTKIEKGFSQVPRVDSFAQSLNLSVSHFQHLFRQEVGKTFSGYVKDLRLQKAVELLLATNLTVKEITAKVGAKDESHFLRDFKCKFGDTPTQYRKIYRINGNR